MPVTPTLQPRPGSGHPQSSREKQRQAQRLQDERKSELVCRVKYQNTLPDIPFDTKFLSYPFEQSRFVSYKPTSLEKNYKYEMLTEHDLGITVDLVLPDAYAVTGEEDVMLDPKDEKLLEEDFGGTAKDRKRSQMHDVKLSWMRKPDYISTEQTRFQPTTIEKIESRVGFAVRKKLGIDVGNYMNREAQIEKIEKTFEDAKIEIKEHHTKKNVYPEYVMPIKPDGDMWKFPCAQVIFDSDPAPFGFDPKVQNEMMSQAMIRGVMDESGEQFVAYFLPTEETMEKRATDSSMLREYDEEQDYEYKMAREYNWIVKSKANKGYEENYFMVQREDGFYYNELETRVRLSKRRLKAGQQASNSKLVVKHRPMIKQELKMQRYRERNLEPPNEEEELSEDDEEPEEQLPQTAEGGGENRSRSNSASSRGSGRSAKSRSRSRSKSRSRSGSRKSGSRSRSGSRKSGGSKSRSRSGSRQSGSARSRSGSPEARRSRSKSGSRSRSGSPGSRKSRSRSGSGSRGSRSRSGSKSSKSSRTSRSRSPGSNSD